LNKTVEQGISDIVGCLTNPIVVFPGGWRYYPRMAEDSYYPGKDDRGHESAQR